MTEISLKTLVDMISGGEQILFLEQNHINDLNVFPVPDGDTGINMYTTIKGALVCVRSENYENLEEFGKIFVKGMLMNARGNSGVIFSQIMRGFANDFGKNTTLNINDLKNAFVQAKEWSYKSVNNPVEGTILTIIRCIAEHIGGQNYDSVEKLFDDVVKVGQNALDSTPELLSELKEVGVVDSGGYGLLAFLKGMNAVLNNTFDTLKNEITKANDSANAYNLENFEFFSNKKEEGFGYCSEVIINLNLEINPYFNKNKREFHIDEFKAKLAKIGDSIVCTQYDNLIKVHVHTMTPNKLLALGQKYGEFERVKIENMTLQWTAKINEGISNSNNFAKGNIEEGIAIIMTAPTKEIAEFVKSDFDVDEVIVTEGKVAPGVAKFLKTIFAQNKQNVIIITDDANTIMTANEAKKFQNKIKVEVIGGRNLFEAIVCASMVNKKISLFKNVMALKQELNKTLSATISTAIRNTDYKNLKVVKGNKIGIINKRIVVANDNEFVVLKTTLDKLMTNKKFDICYLVCGKNTNKKDIEMFEKYADEQYNLCCEIKDGQQEIYDYYLGLQ